MKSLQPAQDTLERIIVTQRDRAKKEITKKIANRLNDSTKEALDKLLKKKKGDRFSSLQSLKRDPRKPSPSAMLQLIGKLEKIELTGILNIDIQDVNYNYQKLLSKIVDKYDANRIINLDPNKMYSAMTCYLWHLYRDTIDFVVDMHDKIMTKISSKAEREIDTQIKSKRRAIKKSFSILKDFSDVLFDEDIENENVRNIMLNIISKDDLIDHLDDIDFLLNGKYRALFNLG